MCSKSKFEALVNSPVSPRKKKLYDDSDDIDTVIKKIKEATSGGRTLAQKRLEKIRLQAAAKKSREGNKNVSKTKPSSSGSTNKGDKPSNEKSSCLEKYSKSTKKKEEVVSGEFSRTRPCEKKIESSKTSTLKVPSVKSPINEERKKVQKLKEDELLRNIQIKLLQKQFKKEPGNKKEVRNNNSSKKQDKVNNNLIRNLYKRKPVVSSTENDDFVSNKKIKKPIYWNENTDLCKNSTNVRNISDKEVLPLKESLPRVRIAVLPNNKETSKDYLNKRQDSGNVNNDFAEDMEWEDVACEDVIMHLQTVRNTVDKSTNIEMMDWQESPLQINKTPDNNIIHYVVDTNVLVSCLRLIKKIKEEIIEENIIVIPWQVLKELDCLKTRKAEQIASAARKAIDYLLSCKTKQSSNVVWQTQQQAAEKCQDFFVEIPDDHIIKCCFQLKSCGHNVILLSNDKNLRLKASVHQILAISDEKFLEKIAFESRKNTEYLSLEEQPVGTSTLEIYSHKFTEIFKKFLNNIIRKYLESIHGNMWTWCLSEKFPLSLKTLLELFQNFGPKIFKTNEYKTYIDAIILFFTRRTYSNLSTTEVDSITRKSLKLAKLFPTENDYVSEVVQFEDDLSFMKSQEPSTHIPFNDLCCKLTIQHFQKFESIIIGFSFKVAEVVGINFAESNLSDRPLILPTKFELNKIFDYLNIVKVIHTNLERLGRLHPRQIYVHTRGIVPIYNTLVTYIEEHELFFTVEDVVEFFKNESIRSGLPEALEVFSCVIQFLESAKQIALNKKIL